MIDLIYFDILCGILFTALFWPALVWFAKGWRSEKKVLEESARRSLKNLETFVDL